MRALSIKTYAILGLGSSFVHYQCAATQSGLLVQIKPELSFSKDMPFHEKMIEITEEYTLLLNDMSIESDFGANIMQTCLKTWNCCKSYLTASLCESPRSKSQTNSIIRKGSGKDLLVPLLPTSDVPVGEEDMTDRGKLWRMATPIPATINGEVYTIGWKLSGLNLIEWIRSNLIYTTETGFHMSTQTYLTGNKGLYYLKWTATKGYEMNRGHREFSRDKVARLFEGHLSAEVYLHGSTQLDQKIRIDFDVEGIKLPISHYDAMVTELLANYRLSIRPNGKRIQIQQTCDSIQPGLSFLDMKITFSAFNFIVLKAEHYLKEKNGGCTLLMEKSFEEKTWVLGPAVLKASSLIMENTGEEINYLFIQPPETVKERSEKSTDKTVGNEPSVRRRTRALIRVSKLTQQ